MKNITRSLFRLPTVLMVLLSLFISVAVTKACPLNNAGAISGPAIAATDNVVNRTGAAQFHIPDTFPLFKIFSKNKEKVKTVREENSTSLFPNSRSYLKPYECKVVFDGTDPGTGERKKELMPEPFISYTAPNLKPYLPGKDLLQATAQLIKFSGGYIYLSVTFDWNAKNPNASYGRLKANGALRCHLTDDKSVTIYNTKESIWHKKGTPDSYTLQALFLLHPKQIKLFKEHSMKAVTVYWERGYEEYPVYPISLFMDQLNCLE